MQPMLKAPQHRLHCINHPCAQPISHNLQACNFNPQLPCHRTLSGRLLQTCSHSQVHQFDEGFRPSDSNIPRPWWITTPQRGPHEDNAVPVTDRSQYADASFWKEGLPGSVRVRVKNADKARITPLAVPGTTAPVASPSTYIVDLEKRYDLGGVVVEEQGKLVKYVLDSKLPPYYFYSGIQQELAGDNKVLQAVVAIAYVAVLAATSAFLWSIQPMLFAAAAVSWLRNTLSIGKWLILAALAATDRVWLYFVFVAAKMLDQVLKKHLPPVRDFMWGLLLCWVLYIFLSPVYYHPLPFVQDFWGTVWHLFVFTGIFTVVYKAVSYLQLKAAKRS